MIDLLLKVSAFLAIGLGVAHSLLGERYILERLFKRDDLPQLFGSQEFTIRTLRFAWHLTSVAWIGFAGILMLLAQPIMTYRSVAMVVAVTFLVSGAITAYSSRGRHLAWPVFMFIGAVAVATAYD